MNKIDHYLHAGTRDNTRVAYQAAVRHYEIEWGGFLPATSENIAQYLADHAETLAMNTLRQRLAALAQWHIDQGFTDPTKAPLIKKILRGIQREHPAQEKQAKPFQLEQLSLVDRWLKNSIAAANVSGDRSAELRHTRNRALLLLGFWRGFRGDELTRLRIEYIEIVPGQGMSLFLPHTKSDRQNKGSTFKAPALKQLCPVAAYTAWKELTGLMSGPVFRSVNRWGHIGDDGLHMDSLIPLLRTIFKDAGVINADDYSAHSLRRGFANWASSSGWDLKTLMEYVGWKSVQSAMRYIDAVDPFSQHRIESSLSLHDNVSGSKSRLTAS
ncbi:site-specific integrase [Undibacterium sp. Ji42W]|uniref:site-specific integrase n=1 Tax=Undibacterium sp. Ji42W TaxID=3413039 RepID=UPI003BF18A01